MNPPLWTRLSSLFFLSLVVLSPCMHFGCEDSPPPLGTLDPVISKDRSVSLDLTDFQVDPNDPRYWDERVQDRSDQRVSQSDQFINPNQSDAFVSIQRCLSPCDCTPGLDCIQGQCQQGESAVYCCGLSPCPQDALCATPQNELARCGQCSSACDCQLGQACENNQCVASNIAPLCCDRSPCPSGQTCERPTGESGVCPEICLSHCDCYAGQVCVQGQCQRDQNDPLGQAGYCCERDLCPQNASCQHPDGSEGICPSTPCTNACDCPGTEACVNGECRQDPEVGLSYCCVDTPCPENRVCDLPEGGQSTCPSEPECQSACDCFDGYACENGQCVFSSEGGIVMCCEKESCISGLRCQNRDGSFDVCE